MSECTSIVTFAIRNPRTEYTKSPRIPTRSIPQSKGDNKLITHTAFNVILIDPPPNAPRTPSHRNKSNYSFSSPEAMGHFLFPRVAMLLHCVFLYL